MIKVERQREPDYLKSKEIDLAVEKMEEFFSSKNRGQKRYDWPFNREIDNELRKILHEVFHGKCGYCETLISDPSFGTVDRFRPNNGVRDKKNYFEDLYWWLAFDWMNLIYCCKECNQYKANYFPIRGDRALSKADNLDDERRMLVNPYEDNPNTHFYYDESGGINPFSEEGNQTIALLRLDRSDLVERRRTERKALIDTIEEIQQKESPSVDPLAFGYLRDIYYESDKTIQFLALKKATLIQEIDTTPFLGQILGLEEYQQSEDWIKMIDPEIKDSYSKEDLLVSDYFPIEYIHIRNFKSIKDLKIEFKEDEINKKSWLFLLGENGVGKSSILQAMALGLKLDKEIVESRISSLIAKGEDVAEIEIKERKSDNILRTKLNRTDSSFKQSGEFKSYLIGYGSLRLSVDEVGDEPQRDTLNVSYKNLFNPTKALNDVTKWLKDTQEEMPEFFDRIAVSIKQLLPHDKSDTDLSIKNGEIVLGGSEASFSDLSDGYKSTITLAIDIMMKLSDAQSDMDKMSGIVLIDELGNQLHPRWQMRIVKQLRTVFPNINFIISTHHPLCLRGAAKDEILLLRNIEGQVVGITELPDPALLRIDQILASEFFGLSSLVDPDIEAKFNRYYELLAKGESVSLKEKEEISQLMDELREKRQLGNSLREEVMYTVIDKLLAEKVNFNQDSVSRKELKEEAVRRVKEIWKNLNLGGND